jgi:hypothetical protein
MASSILSNKFRGSAIRDAPEAQNVQVLNGENLSLRHGTEGLLRRGKKT